MAEQRQQAARKLARMRESGRAVAPVVIKGRTIARSFWGKAWCSNLERYSDYAHRLPRGRTYVRTGSVLDLTISKGEVAAIVAGSEIYTIKIAIAPPTAPCWAAIRKDCAGSIDSIVELLRGRLAQSVMDRVCREGDGLFPGPNEIKLSCSCPDWASMCKHVAAALYGVGARLDEKPELLFVLRGVDEKELISSAGTDLVPNRRAAAKGKILVDTDMAALFGLDMAEGADNSRDRRAATKSGTVRAKAASAKKANSSNTPTGGRSKLPALKSKLKAPTRPRAAPASSVGRGRSSSRKRPKTA